MSLELYTLIAEDLAINHEVTQSQMFGKKCLKVNGKAFAAFHLEEMVFKLGKEWISKNTGKFPGAKNWDPSGKNRPMKDWLSVPAEYRDSWMELAVGSIETIDQR